jgi:toxin CcdB
MARYHVYRLGDDLAVDVQADLFDSLHTRVMIPLIPKGDVGDVVPRLNPIVEIDSEKYVMMTEFLATVPTAGIGPRVADLRSHADKITAAIDFLLGGF